MRDEGNLKMATLMLFAVVAMSIASGVNGEDKQPLPEPFNKNIENLCQSTDYRKPCIQSLEESKAANSSDPNELFQAALAAGVSEIKKAIENSTTIKEAAKDPRTAQALDICDQLMGYAAGDLNKSISAMHDFDISKLDDFVEDLKTWLSGAITFHEACLDAFQNTTGDASTKMKALLNTSRELSSNGLAMATQVSDLLKSFDLSGLKGLLGRRLLSPPEERSWLPKWVSHEKRVLIEAGPLSSNDSVKPDLVIAKDGSGKYKTLNESLKDIPLKSNKTYVIHVKEGEYKENVEFSVDMWNIALIGDGADKTKITGNLSFADGIPALKTATFAALGDQFMAKDIAFENTAGLDKRQAIALLSSSDRSIFYNCSMIGHMNTLYALTYRQFYRECNISGSVDFIIGDAAAVFQKCNITLRQPTGQASEGSDEEGGGEKPEAWCSICAQGRVEERVFSGTVLQNCTITGDKSYMEKKNETKSYLGRPWKKFSRVVVMESSISDVIDPEGWKAWMGSFGQETCEFMEYNNTGSGADKSKRVDWKGVKKDVNKTEVEKFTPAKFLLGDEWIKTTGVPYSGGFSSE